MADITKCLGKTCSWRLSCYRYTAPCAKHHQSYYVEQPSEIVNGEFSCEKYMPVEKGGTKDFDRTFRKTN